MRGYEWGSGTVRCGFCYVHGHNITSCSHVDSIFKQLCNKLDANPHYLPTPDERKAFIEVKRREEAKVKPRKPRRKGRCSFCGSEKHKRNKCTHLVDFKNKVLRANRTWKENFVKAANEAGYGVGSLVTVPIGVLSDYEPSMGIIMRYNKDKVNVFCDLASQSIRHSSYQGTPTVDIMADNEVFTVDLGRLKGFGNRFDRGWNYYEVISISPCEWNPDEEWYSEDDNKAFRWFFGDISHKKRTFPLVYELIKKWDKK